MVNVFDFTDFREYLRTYFEDKKLNNSRFSYQLLAQKAGFNNRGFVYNIIKGNKTLSKEHVFKISRALGLNKKETAYFESIVDFTQAKNEQLRTHYLEQIQENSNKQGGPLQMVKKDQYCYYTKWYHSAVRSLIGMYDISDNYDFISQRIFPPITIAQAKNSVELLARLELIIKDNDGIYKLTGKSIKASDEISQIALNGFHVEYTELAKQSIIYPLTELQFKSSITLGISETTYKVILEESEKFRAKIAELANIDETADRVYQYQLVFFPLSITGVTNTAEDK